MALAYIKLCPTQANNLLGKVSLQTLIAHQGKGVQ